jgi:hypothetical protein
MKKDYYKLPEEECVRMTRPEMISMNWLYAAENSCAYGRDDLARRIEMIPHGKRRFNMMLGQLRAIVNDITGTMPEPQKQKVRNTMKDMELRLVPKMTKRDVAVVLSKEEAMTLFDYAKSAKCTTCIKDSEECLKCDLYKIMMANVPLEDYDKGYLCPYNLAEWEDKE